MGSSNPPATCSRPRSSVSDRTAARRRVGARLVVEHPNVSSRSPSGGARAALLGMGHSCSMPRGLHRRGRSLGVDADVTRLGSRRAPRGSDIPSPLPGSREPDAERPHALHDVVAPSRACHEHAAQLEAGSSDGSTDAEPSSARRGGADDASPSNPRAPPAPPAGAESRQQGLLCRCRRAARGGVRRPRRDVAGDAAAHVIR